MKVVILAAGFGSRMGGSTPKPLVKLFGLPLIEHKIRRFKEEDIVVVYSNKHVKEYIQKKFPKITLVYNPFPERENGYSLYCAKKYIKENEKFILLMADHFYGEKFYSDLEKIEGNTIFVSKTCIDRTEATKVKVSKKYVEKIGKEIKNFDFFDTGFFVCSYEIFDYIEKLLHKEKIKLSDVMQLLSNEKKLLYKYIDDFWIDIDTKKDLKIAEQFIRESLSKPSDGFISRFINRKISTRITPLIVEFDFLTPNRITVIIGILGILSALPFLFKKYILGGILTQLVSVIDGCDGEVARIKNQKSKFGAVLDSILDRYVDTAIIFSIFLSLPDTFLSKISLFFSVTGTVFVSYVSKLTNVRPYFATRDIRLFLIMLGGVFSYIYNDISILATLFIIGVLSHSAVLYSILKYRHSKS